MQSRSLHERVFGASWFNASIPLLLLALLGMNALTATSALASSPRVFYVTGATDGIGMHTAKKLAKDGHGLIVHGRNPSKGAELEAELQKCGAAFVHYLNADLADLPQVENLAKESASLMERHGIDHIDVLINNAGVFDPTPATSYQGFDTTWAVNVMAPFLLTRRLLPWIAKGTEPRIITTSSISQSDSLPPLDELFQKGTPNSNNGPFSSHKSYSYSKLGDLMFTKQLANILASCSSPQLSCIKCLTMDPGTVNTKMLLAGWGPCGIDVSQADNTYKLAATDYGGRQESGSYHFGFRAASSSKDPQKLKDLWTALEHHTGCSYDDIETGL
mmetsp:Transcript_5162/g.7851  ORF Transcript_5162/g.7851 Transcript_5162/m.7851 type:complete len:332 (+) Transcript_5162:39-1034(+)